MNLNEILQKIVFFLLVSVLSTGTTFLRKAVAAPIYVQTDTRKYSIVYNKEQLLLGEDYDIRYEDSCALDSRTRYSAYMVRRYGDTDTETEPHE